MTNISIESSPQEAIARLMVLVGQPARLQIILALEQGQSCCVCHLEAYLGLRQAAISQHLMLLRSAGLVETRREGRHIFYHLAHPGLPELVRQAALLSGADPLALQQSIAAPLVPCPCPHCCPEGDCKPIRRTTRKILNRDQSGQA